MARALFGLCALLLCVLARARHDDDFAFDNGDELQVELTTNHTERTKSGLRRLWGVPDTSAYIGHLFRMEIPKEAFSGEVTAYKVRGEGGRRAPGWLAVDARHGLISGVPLAQDAGALTLTVTAHAPTPGLTAADTFTVEVKKAEEKPRSKYGWCGPAESKMVLVILLDVHFHQIKPRQRIRSLMELAKFMALDGEEFSIEPYKSNEVQGNQVVVQSGPGSSQRRKGDGASAIMLNVGCEKKLWARHKVLVAGLREQARDGTLAHVLRLPVLGWRVVAMRPVPRHKRQIPETGSGAYYDEDGDDADYSGYDDDDDEDYGAPPLDPVTDADENQEVKIIPYSESGTKQANKTSVKFASRSGFSDDIPTTTSEPDVPTVVIRASSDIIPVIAASPALPMTTSTTNAPDTAPPPTVSLSPTTTLPSSSAATPATTPIPTTTPVPETTLPEVTRQETVVSTEKSSTVIGRTTETVIFNIPYNQAPTLKHHMKKLAVTAGKAFRYIIPVDLFTDPEDGTNLTFKMYGTDNAPLKSNSWVQFYPGPREVYGLPLDEHVSRWPYFVEASDSQGETARGPLDITVQQHKGRRTVNHEFYLQLKLNQPYEHSVDWQIRVLEGLVNLFRDTDEDHMTVRNVTSHDGLVEFVWTNDTLPKETCPTEDINRLMGILELDGEKTQPSALLTRAMSPQLKVAGVGWRALGVCAAPPAPPAVAPPAPNLFPPVPRNQVDLVRATAGHLLLYKVPEDTFYDPEDGGTRALKLSVVRGNRSPLPSVHWMQFDSRNQEFYGLPTDRDVGKQEYQLIAEDSSGKTAYDMLLVEVSPAPAIRPTVEFHMTLEYSNLASGALIKRKFLEKLAALFGDRDTSAIRVKSITDHPTTVVWYNTSLPMDRCPNDEIEQLKKIIINEERQGSPGNALTEHVDAIFDKDFKVMSVRLVPRGLCAEQGTNIYKPTTPVDKSIPVSEHDTKSVSADNYTEYLITFIIPAVVVVCMILIAGIIACVLYRRRRTGKMSVGDEEERQAFRSKGIPVIFQDELDERPDPADKSPVIMREEKPPLLPPPDYRAGDSPAPHSPYRPPPPFAAPHAQRPKPTPTYRKPPPYVPP